MKRTIWKVQCLIGFAKSKSTLKRNLPLFARLYQRVLKVQLMGSAALALTRTAAGD